MTDLQKRQLVAGIITLALVISGIYLWAKHSKTPGFWWGFWTVFLLVSGIYVTEKGTEFRMGPFGVSVEND